MPTELDYLKKLSKGLKQQPTNENSKKENSKGEQDVKTTGYTSIPLRSLEAILNETSNQEKKE